MKSIITGWTIAILLGLFALGRTVSAKAQQATPTASPAPTQALEPTVQALTTEVSDLTKTVETQAKTFDVMLSVIAVATVAAGVAGVTVISGMKWAETRFKDRLNQAIYRVDPTYFTLYIPKHDFEKEKRRLELLGFKNLRPFAALSSAQKEGITVFKAVTPEDVKVLRRFLTEEKVDLSKAAFVIYVQGKLDEAYELANEFDNVVAANFPVTIATQVYALARGLL
jgi:hypothetical protein